MHESINLDEEIIAYEEYDTHFPPDYSETESDNEIEEEPYIPPPPRMMHRRHSIAPPPMIQTS